jgi:hypothetical protein
MSVNKDCTLVMLQWRAWYSFVADRKLLLHIKTDWCKSNHTTDITRQCVPSRVDNHLQGYVTSQPKATAVRTSDLRYSLVFHQIFRRVPKACLFSAWILRLRVRTPLEAWMFVPVFLCCAVLCRQRLYAGLITHPRSPAKCLNWLIILKVILNWNGPQSLNRKR